MSTKTSKNNFAIWVAKRYLFSKKSHNAINIISAISAMGVLIGTAALICVLSVFNGFESLVQNMFSAFDPDLKISLVEGKTFDANTATIEKIKTDKSVVAWADEIRETALLSYNDRQTPVQVLGVSEGFGRVTRIDSIMYDGNFLLTDGNFEHAVVGIGIASKLGINAQMIEPMRIFAPKRTEKINVVRPDQSFNEVAAFASGIFVVNQPEYDDQNVIVSIAQARKLFEYSGNEVSNLQLKVSPDADIKAVKKDFERKLGKRFKVQNKYEQQEDFFKITKIEKWITYLILVFILMIATFNIIGSLSMLILEKKEDIEILRSLGAEDKLIKQIFIFEGWLITTSGAVIGAIIGVLVILAQQHFGFLKLGGDNYIVDAYPVVLSFTDILISLSSVLLMGFLAVLYPAKYIRQ